MTKTNAELADRIQYDRAWLTEAEWARVIAALRRVPVIDRGPQVVRYSHGNLYHEPADIAKPERPPSGEMVMVPREPTKKMLDAAIAGQSFPQDFGRDYQGRALNEATRIYHAMLSAAEASKEAK